LLDLGKVCRYLVRHARLKTKACATLITHLCALLNQRREPAMDDVAEKIIAILRKNMRDPNKEITLDTKLTDLEIESLDLAVIVFDIEDTFGIQIPYNANEEVQDFATVNSVVDRVKAVLAGAHTSNAAA
jgi:nodulation protein F